eukprot:scaffold6615_cov115-Skeletonema_dohrnii-CCMP3373.AAC.2
MLSKVVIGKACGEERPGFTFGNLESSPASKFMQPNLHEALSRRSTYILLICVHTTTIEPLPT